MAEFSSGQHDGKNIDFLFIVSYYCRQQTESIMRNNAEEAKLLSNNIRNSKFTWRYKHRFIRNFFFNLGDERVSKI